MIFIICYISYIYSKSLKSIIRVNTMCISSYIPLCENLIVIASDTFDGFVNRISHVDLCLFTDKNFELFDTLALSLLLSMDEKLHCR